MAMPTDDELQALIQVECNVTSDTTVASNIPMWWEVNSQYSKDLQYLYTRQAVLRYLTGKYREKITLRIGSDVFNYRELFLNAMAMLNETTGSIADAKSERGAGRLSSSHPDTPYLPTIGHVRSVLTEALGGKPCLPNS